MDKQELLKEIRELYQQKHDIQNKIDKLNIQLDEIEKEEAGREYKLFWKDGSIDLCNYECILR